VKRVLVCLRRDKDSRAQEVAKLVEENYKLVLKYKSVKEIPILLVDNPVFNNPR
jgi:hypothetical protein